MPWLQLALSLSQAWMHLSQVHTPKIPPLFVACLPGLVWRHPQERIRELRILGEGQPAHWISKKGLRETSWSFSRLKQMLFKSDVPLCLTFPNGCKGHSLLCLQLDHFQCHQLAVDPVRSQQKVTWGFLVLGITTLTVSHANTQAEFLGLADPMRPSLKGITNLLHLVFISSELGASPPG